MLRQNLPGELDVDLGVGLIVVDHELQGAPTDAALLVDVRFDDVQRLLLWRPRRTTRCR